MVYFGLGFVLTVVAGLWIAWRTMVWMPGKSPHALPDRLDENDVKVREQLTRDLTVLAQDIGERHVTHRYAQLVQAADFIDQSLRDAGYVPRRQELEANGQEVWNIDVECTGHRRSREVIVVGAHYDTVPGSPGANDNGSAVVANLALARAFADLTPDRSVRFAFFVNEEFPYCMTDAMGSLRYAEQCKADAEGIVGMISLETIGYLVNRPDTQRYPVAFLRCLYPTTGNFIAVVGNVKSRRLVHRLVRALRRRQFPTQGMAAPRWLKDIFRSDHAAFWHCGYPAVMITDTANFRYPYYHTSEDSIDKINFDMLACLVGRLTEGLLDLAGKAER